MNYNVKQTIDLLKSKNNILIITHKNPDGDAIGSGFGLYYTLLKMKKKVAIDIGKLLPDAFKWVANNYNNKFDFKPDFIVSVDLADPKLLLDHLKYLKNKIDLSIDHHQSNTSYAKYTLLDSEAASTSQLLFDVISGLIGNDFDSHIASCLYLGLSTDSGCFKYSSVTEKTHLVAANLIKNGADHFHIDKKMFDTKSKQKLNLEINLLSNMEYFFNDRCSLIFVSKSIKDSFNVMDDELEGLSVLPTQIEGVEVGVTIKEKDNEYKISIRTNENYDASEICKPFGGGGHKRAAGCSIKGNFSDVKDQLLSVIEKCLADNNQN